VLFSKHLLDPLKQQPDIFSTWSGQWHFSASNQHLFRPTKIQPKYFPLKCTERQGELRYFKARQHFVYRIESITCDVVVHAVKLGALKKNKENYRKSFGILLDLCK